MRKGSDYKTDSPNWSKEGMRLNAAYDPSPMYAPERCDNGYDHNPLGFKEEMAQAHAIRRGVNG